VQCREIWCQGARFDPSQLCHILSLSSGSSTLRFRLKTRSCPGAGSQPVEQHKTIRRIGSHYLVGASFSSATEHMIQGIVDDALQVPRLRASLVRNIPSRQGGSPARDEGNSDLTIRGCTDVLLTGECLDARDIGSHRLSRYACSYKASVGLNKGAIQHSEQAL
jgi:hypothetical protein